MSNLKSCSSVIGFVFVGLCSHAWATALPFGQAVTGTISSVAQSNSYTFSANASDVIDFTIVNTAGKLSPALQVYDPSGKQIASATTPYYCGNGPAVELNTVQLTVTGTYTILVSDCSDTNTGSYTIYAQRTNNPTGAGSLTFGGQPQAGTIGSAAQSNSYTFNANANDIIDFTIVLTSGNLSPRIRVYNPAGTQVGSATTSYYCGNGPAVELNTLQLTSTGTYTVLAGDCGDTNTGNYVIYMQRTNNPAGAAVLQFGGQPQTGTVGSPAQSDSYTFSGTANAVVNFTAVAISGNLSARLRLYNPAGAQIASATTAYYCGNGPTVEMTSITLPANGTYTLLLGDCSDTNTGNYNLSAQCIGTCPAPGPTLTSQTITFGPLNNQTLGAAPFLLSATASSGLPVTLTSNTTSVCTVSGFIVTLVAAGACSITASQPGNSTYAAAAPVTQTFTVNSDATVNAAPSITSISQISTQQNQTIMITGSGFGTHAPYTGDSAYILLFDLTEDNWSAGYAGPCFAGACNDLVTLVVNSWTDSQIVLGGFAGSWGSNGLSFSGGDQVLVYVWNAQSGAGPASIITAVAAQAPQCAYSLAPGAQVIAAAAGTGSVGVLTEAGCAWTASSGTSFLSITSGASGTGPGTVQFSATANTASSARSGTLTIAGQTATVNQTGTAPLLLLSPSSINVQWRQQSALPAAIPVSVYTGATSLSFTAAASSTGDWLSVSPASGSAPATVIVTVNPSSLQPGTYQGTVAISAPTANPSSQTFTVSLTVIAVGAPTLSVTTNTLTYSFGQGAQQAQQQRILIANSGGGTLSYQASASTNSGGNWLSVMQDGAGATPTTPDPLTVNVNPSGLAVGTYTGAITITANTTQTIPVSVTVGSVQQTILLSQTGLTFTAVANGGIVPPQTFGVLNSGTGVMSWAVSSTTLNGGNWLAVTPNSGTTDASSLTVPLLTASVNPANLAPGQYSGQIQVTAIAANNTPQFVSVILNVLPAGSNPGPLVLPTGLIFTQAAAGSAAGSQTITLSNLSASQETFTTGKLTIDGANWFSVTPATGTAATTQATTLTVSVSSAGLSPAIRQGVLTLLFQDGSVRTVNILFLLVSGGDSGQSAIRPLATTSCTPTMLLPLITSLGSQFTVPAAWPSTLEAQVADDCGNPQVNGTVTATFSNGDPPLPLISLKNGNWTGTWQVTNSNASVIAVTVNADDPALMISGSISVSGGLQSSANAPLLSTGGVLNAASYSPSAPLAPGSMISIFGSNLADGTSNASSFPLPSELSGALVTIGGQSAPLIYAGSGQINAVIPYGLPVNASTQVIVRQGNAYTSPMAIVMAAANPAIFTVSETGSGQGVIVRPDGNVAQPGTPAQTGDEIVIWATGLGETTPGATDGEPATASPLLAVSGVTLTIGGQTARVDFAGLAPGFTGVYQINAAVPVGVQGDTLPVVLTVAGQPSPVVTMAVQ